MIAEPLTDPRTDPRTDPLAGALAGAPTGAAGPDALADALAAERPRLVRFCARYAGDPHTAEDLAQETLARAWAALDRLRDPAGLAPWLTAIARNVCLHWARTQRRDLAHRAPPTHAGERNGDGAGGDDPHAATLDDLPAEQDEPAIALERGELAHLLDRALALLPAATRRLLLESYVNERPHADLAARLQLSEGALRVRLHRGRLALRQVLASELRAEAAAFDLALPQTTDWHESRIWCPFCGQHHLRMRVDRATGEYAFHCAGPCHPQLSVVGSARFPEMLAQVHSPKSILARHCLFLAAEYRRMIRGGADTCGGCGRPVTIRHWRHDDPPFPYQHGVYATCLRCGILDSASAWHLTLDTPEAVRFWRRHPRIRPLPTHEIEVAGRPALVTGYESVESAARIEIVSARDTWETLSVRGERMDLGASGEVEA